MLILLCGLPRAGKTTYSMRFKEPYEVVHTDMCGMKYARERVERANGDIVVDGVYKGAKERTELCRAYNGELKKCIWLDTPKEIRMRRANYNRHCDFPFKPPTYDEGWDEIEIIRG